MIRNRGYKQRKLKRQHPEDPNLFWCPNCKSYKPREEFSVNSSRKSGLQSKCKECTGVSWSLYRERNIDKIRGNNAKYRKYLRENKPESIKERKREFYKRHRLEEKMRLDKYKLKKNLIQMEIHPTDELIEEQYGKLIYEREKRKRDAESRRKEKALKKIRECVRCGRIIKYGKYCDDHKPIAKEVYRFKYNTDPEFKREARIRTKVYKHTHPEKLSKWGDNRRRRVAQSSDGSVNPIEINALMNKYKKCPYCGKSISESDCHIDHIIPIAKGGSHSITNIIPCCSDCNHRKSAAHIEDWLERLDNKHKRLVKKIMANNECYQLSLI